MLGVEKTEEELGLGGVKGGVTTARARVGLSPAMTHSTRSGAPLRSPATVALTSQPIPSAQTNSKSTAL